MSNVIDLFSGVGGLSLGAARAGFNVAGAIEIDSHAVSSHIRNFPATKHSDISVAKLSGKNIADISGLRIDEIDGIIGGPPCQGFSTIGKQDRTDKRNNLFNDFFRIVKEVQPRFFLAENVPGILDPKYDSIQEMALAQVADDYELITPFKVKASDYGAPTIRTRVLFIGYKKEYIDKLSQTSFAPDADTQQITVEKALTGLPANIDPNWIKEQDGWRKIVRMGDSHFARNIHGRVPENIGHRESIERFDTTDYVSGCLGTRHTAPVAERYDSLLPGKSDKISKSTRLVSTGFCPTLRAGTGSDKGSFQAVRPIHPTKGRVITPREAARLQGFPDWFQFHRTKWHSFRQIGNSVSPILAEEILTRIHKRFND
ncbi:MAG: DNA cytosine methyltransferase [Mariprofundaceae bacterium]|nr:DNA cytosine methyltransferase [Mariprofundaceae bacterium]